MNKNLSHIKNILSLNGFRSNYDKCINNIYIKLKTVKITKRWFIL